MSFEEIKGVIDALNRTVQRVRALEDRLTDLEKQVEEHRKRWLE